MSIKCNGKTEVEMIPVETTLSIPPLFKNDCDRVS